MAKSVKHSLLPGESIVFEADASKIAYITSLVKLLVMMQPFSLMRLVRTELAVTNQRIIGSSGVGGRKQVALPFRQVAGITVTRGFLGLMFDYGNVSVHDKTDTKVVFKGISCPFLFQMEANEAIEKEVLGYTLAEYVPDP